MVDVPECGFRILEPTTPDKAGILEKDRTG